MGIGVYQSSTKPARKCKNDEGENIRYECKRLQNVSNAKGDEKQQQKYTTEHSQQKIHVQIAKSKAMRESGNWTIEIH